MKIENRKFLSRCFMLLAVSPLLGGCIITPRVEMTERIDFNYHAPAIQSQMSAPDLMCCTECRA